MSDERVERVARELHAMDSAWREDCGFAITPWDTARDEVREVYRARAQRILSIADAPRVPDEAVGGLMEGIER